ncbi:LysM peptidoglycan-binding domain-containing protein [Halalkalibacter kiskunsagensis]|uniref:LysM peptidoglycan-binding domain-containing protein n=1 Tax=Halalkalibacter kiskunsagensis TaxID=1548599 RepID=A0ABV6KGL4_9BACI
MKRHIVSLVTVAAIVGTFSFGMNVSAEEVVVQKGDTLWSIANKNNVEVEELKEWNGLSSNLILIGDRLTVSTAEQYSIKSGDTLSSIASQYDGVSTKNLQDWNQIDNPNLIVTGDILTVYKSGSKSTTDDAPVKEKQVQQEEPVQTTTDESTTDTDENVAKELTMTATAYTASCNGCSGITATGLNLLDNPDKKVISVDPNVIPLGSKVYVEGYGEAIAGDTGGAIKGNKIDLFIPEKQDAINFGVQEVNVKVYK